MTATETDPLTTNAVVLEAELRRANRLAEREEIVARRAQDARDDASDDLM